MGSGAFHRRDAQRRARARARKRTLSSWRRLSPIIAPRRRKRRKSSAAATSGSRSSSNPRRIFSPSSAAQKAIAILVGFAAETDRIAENARAKLERKGADMIVANDVTAGRRRLRHGHQHRHSVSARWPRDAAAEDEQVRSRQSHPRSSAGNPEAFQVAVASSGQLIRLVDPRAKPMIQTSWTHCERAPVKLGFATPRNSDLGPFYRDRAAVAAALNRPSIGAPNRPRLE